MLTRETSLFTRSSCKCSVKSTLATKRWSSRSFNTPPNDKSPTSSAIRCLSAGSMRALSTDHVIARYMAPELTYTKSRRRDSRRATLLFPEAAGPSIAITRCRSCPCISDSREMSAVFRGTRAEASACLFLHRRGWGKRTDDRRAGAGSSRTHELLQGFFESGIRFTNTLGVLNNCFAVGKKSSHRKGHRNSMIAKTRQSSAAQRRRPVDLETVIQLNDLHPHATQIVPDRGDAIGFLDAQLVGVADNCRAVGQRTRNR